jgi:hypothetical protein
MMAAVALILLIGAVVVLTSLDELGSGGGSCPPGMVWAPEHGHCH